MRKYLKFSSGMQHPCTSSRLCGSWSTMGWLELPAQGPTEWTPRVGMKHCFHGTGPDSLRGRLVFPAGCPVG